MSITKGKNSNIELIRGDPKKAIRKLSVPIMLSMALIMAYNIADSIWVSGLGADALAALGFITPVFMIIVGLGNGIGAGANSLIARAIGAKDKDRADNGAVHALVITLILGIIIPIIFLPLLRPMFELMGAGGAISYGMDYGTIVFGLMIVFLVSSVLSALLRSEGDVNRATVAIAITAVLNMVLDPIFIYQFGWGIAGAAWATIISSVISCIVMGYWIWIKKDTYIDANFRGFKFSKDITFDILGVAIPNTAETLIMSILNIGINAMLVLVATTDAVACYTAGMRIVQLSMIPLIGLGTALLTVAGSAYGARDGDKLELSFSYCIKIGLCLSATMGILMYVFSNPLAFIFSYSSATAYLTPQIAQVLEIFCLFTLFVPFGMMAAMVFQGVGKGFVALIITLFRSLIFELVLAYVIGIVLGYGLMGIYAGFIIGSFMGTALGYGLGRTFINRTKKRFKHIT